MSINKVYTSSSLQNSKNQVSNPLGSSYYKENRVDLLTHDVARDLNTYRNWKEFSLALPSVWDENGVKDTNQPVGLGNKSLFSPVAAVYGDVPIREDLNIPLLDTPETRKRIRSKTDCSIRALVDGSSTHGRNVYSYADFMYCKYLGRVSNNYLITLRKFPLPCGDHINSNSTEENDRNKHLPDMGRLVTWLGTPENEMSNILKYSYTIPWQTNNAPIDDEPKAVYGAEGGGALGQLFSTLDGSYNKQLRETNGKPYDDNWVAQRLGGGKAAKPRNLNLMDDNRIVSSRQNMINKVIVPGGQKEGLEFTHEITLTFDYELRSYDGINGKTAFLDLLGNILMVTYLQGKFFPGSYRQANMSQSSLYTNLDIFKNSEATKSPGAFMSSMFKSFSQAISGFGFTKDNIKDTLKNLGQNMFEMMAAGAINKLGRPQQYAMTSLITPTPTGQWHLTIGNPYNPILSIGNLILTRTEIEHYGPLGIDDFPTGLKVKVTLSHAKPRDSVAIEQMYMQGDARIYAPMGEEIEGMYEHATVISSRKKASANIVDMNTTNLLQDKTTIDNINNGNDIKKRIFGTRDIKAIVMTAMEAAVGGEKTNNNQ